MYVRPKLTFVSFFLCFFYRTFPLGFSMPKVGPAWHLLRPDCLLHCAVHAFVSEMFSQTWGVSPFYSSQREIKTEAMHFTKMGCISLCPRHCSKMQACSDWFLFVCECAVDLPLLFPVWLGSLLRKCVGDPDYVRLSFHHTTMSWTIAKWQSNTKIAAVASARPNLRIPPSPPPNPIIPRSFHDAQCKSETKKTAFQIEPPPHNIRNVYIVRVQIGM